VPLRRFDESARVASALGGGEKAMLKLPWESMFLWLLTLLRLLSSIKSPIVLQSWKIAKFLALALIATMGNPNRSRLAPVADRRLHRCQGPVARRVVRRSLQARSLQKAYVPLTPLSAVLDRHNF
jgi:hypothetical protein